jgi:hypothetical protein
MDLGVDDSHRGSSLRRFPLRLMTRNFSSGNITFVL